MSQMIVYICSWLENFLFLYLLFCLLLWMLFCRVVFCSFLNLQFCFVLRQHSTVFQPGLELYMIHLPQLPGDGITIVGHCVLWVNCKSEVAIFCVLPALPYDPDSPQKPLMCCCMHTYCLNVANKSLMKPTVLLNVPVYNGTPETFHSFQFLFPVCWMLFGKCQQKFAIGYELFKPFS